jgi:hypothetical protein
MYVGTLGSGCKGSVPRGWRHGRSCQHTVRMVERVVGRLGAQWVDFGWPSCAWGKAHHTRVWLSLHSTSVLGPQAWRTVVRDSTPTWCDARRVRPQSFTTCRQRPGASGLHASAVGSAGASESVEPQTHRPSIVASIEDGRYTGDTIMHEPNAAMWIRIADALNRLQEAAATARVRRSRAASLRERARELSAQLAPIAKARASATRAQIEFDHYPGLMVGPLEIRRRKSCHLPAAVRQARQAPACAGPCVVSSGPSK